MEVSGGRVSDDPSQDWVSVDLPKVPDRVFRSPVVGNGPKCVHGFQPETGPTRLQVKKVKRPWVFSV